MPARTRIPDPIVRPGARSRISGPGARGRAVTDHRPAGARIPASPRNPGRLAHTADDRATSDRAIGDRAARARIPWPRTPARGITDRPGRPGRRRVTALASRSGQTRIPPRSRGRVFAPAGTIDRGSLRLPGQPERPDRVWFPRLPRCRGQARQARRTCPTALPRLGGLPDPLVRWRRSRCPVLRGRDPLRRQPVRNLPLPDQPAPRLAAPGLSRGDGIRRRGLHRDRSRHRGRDRQRGPRGRRQLADGLLGAGDLGLGNLGRGCDAGLPPHPAEYQDLVFLGQWRHAAPGGRFPQVTHLGDEQFGQAFTFQHRPGRQPREQARRQHIQPEQIVVERQPEQRKKNYVGHRNGGEDCDLPNGQRHWQAEIVELVKPFLNPPDTRIGGQLHQSLSLRPNGDQWTPSAFAIPCASVCTMLGV
jgi:hypothetical protein